MERAEFANLIYFLCARHGGSITSWHRSPKHNAAVGGVTNSKHLTGLAVDIVCDTPKDLAELIDDAKLFALVVIPEDDHVHVQVRA